VAESEVVISAPALDLVEVDEVTVSVEEARDVVTVKVEE
jgi:hypothetical protein